MSFFKIYAGLFPAFFLFPLTGITQPGNIDVTKEKILFLSQKIDSLPYYIKTGKIDVHAVCQLKEHSRYHFKGLNIDFSPQALHLPGSVRTKYIEMYVLFDLANKFYVSKQFDSAIGYWNKALDIAVSHQFDAEALHMMRVALNHNYFLLGDYTLAMKISTEGLSRSEQIGDKNRMAHFNNVIGYIHMRLRNFDKASVYFSAYQQQAHNIKDTVLEAHAMYNLGDLAIAKKEYDNAINFLMESGNLYRSVKRQHLINNQEREGYVSNKLAQCWKLKGDLNQAMVYITISLKITNGVSGVNAYDKADYFINAGDIYNRRLMPDSALLLLKSGLAIAASINHREFKRDAFEQIAIAFSQMKTYDSAFIYQNRFSKLKDSILNESSQQEIFQRDADLQIERQQQLQRAAIQRQKMWRNIIIGIALFSLITLGLLYNRYRLRQGNRYQQQLNRQQNELFNAIALTQDQERKRIAEDIHDSLGSILSAAKLKLSALKEGHSSLSEEQTEKYMITLQLLDEASSELRNISHNIMPATLSKLGLVAALRNLITTISSHSGLQISFSTHDFDKRLDEKTEMSIYRVILELINNVVKHAAADKVTVQLIRYPDYINITIEDNGKGFDYSKALEQKNGIGLGNVLSRVNYMKGSINVDAAPGRGTTVIIDVPMNYPEA